MPPSDNASADPSASASAAEFDVFLSHNSQDKPLVRELADTLIAFGLRPWLDERELVPVRPWQEALEEIIATTKTAGRSACGRAGRARAAAWRTRTNGTMRPRPERLGIGTTGGATSSGRINAMPNKTSNAGRVPIRRTPIPGVWKTFTSKTLIPSSLPLFLGAAERAKNLAIRFRGKPSRSRHDQDACAGGSASRESAVARRRGRSNWIGTPGIPGPSCRNRVPGRPGRGNRS